MAHAKKVIPGMESAHCVSDLLEVLHWHWGEEYEISEPLGVWRAVRRDNQVTLVAETADELRALIMADYAAHPVLRDLPPAS